MLDTPAAEEMRRRVDFLLRRGLTDREVYYEMSRVYGGHVVLDAATLDESIDRRPYGYRAMMGAVAGAALLCVLFRRARRPRARRPAPPRS